jgi:hypothetical protein
MTDKPEDGKVTFPQEGETHWVRYEPTGDEVAATSGSTWRARPAKDVQPSAREGFVWVKDDAAREAVVSMATMLVGSYESPNASAGSRARDYLRLLEAVRNLAPK